MMAINYTAMGQKLQELRKKAHMKQGQVAEALNVSNLTVCKWETGKARPTHEHLVNLTRLYGVTIDEVLVVEEI